MDGEDGDPRLLCGNDGIIYRGDSGWSALSRSRYSGFPDPISGAVALGSRRTRSPSAASGHTCRANDWSQQPRVLEP